MNKLTLNNIAKVLVEKNGLEPKEAMMFTTAMFDLIHDRLNEEGIVKVKGLGTFKMIRVEARESINVRTGERVLIDSHAKITFTPDAVMKELVNKPFSQFETVVLNDDVEFTDMKSEETTDETNNSEQSESLVDVVSEGGTPEPAPEPAPEPVAEVAPEPTPVVAPEPTREVPEPTVPSADEESEENTSAVQTCYEEDEEE